MRGVCFCEKAHFSILYTPISGGDMGSVEI